MIISGNGAAERQRRNRYSASRFNVRFCVLTCRRVDPVLGAGRGQQRAIRENFSEVCPLELDIITSCGNDHAQVSLSCVWTSGSLSSRPRIFSREIRDPTVERGRLFSDAFCFSRFGILWRDVWKVMVTAFRSESTTLVRWIFVRSWGKIVCNIES